ncbi:MAG: DUF4352 domain-containing protein [Candidatus Geothermincolia bacterium]
MRRLLVAALILSLILAPIAGCGDAGGGSSAIPMTVHSAKEYQKTEKSVWAEPEEGSTYLSLDIEITNNTDQALTFWMLGNSRFVLRDDRGYTADGMIPMEDPAFSTDSIPSGQMARGYYTWRIKDDWSTLDLRLYVEGKERASMKIRREDIL